METAATDFEPKFASLKIVLQMHSQQIRQHNRTTKRNMDDDTRTGVLLRVLAHGRDWQDQLGDHLRMSRSVISDKKSDIQDYLGMKQWLIPGTGDVMAIGGGMGKTERQQAR